MKTTVGAFPLARFFLRGNKLFIACWLCVLLAFSIGIPLVFQGMFSSPQDRLAMAITMQNPAMTALFGPGYGMDDYTTGSMMAHEMLLFTLVPVALMNILLTIRHTRRDEEAGRTEMVRALPVGRLSGLCAALLAAAAVNAALALLTGLGMAALGIESMGLNGSLLYGAALGVTGFFFAAASAAFAQGTASARTALGASVAFLCGAYLLRAAGDLGAEALARISPLGLPLRAQVYVRNLWWPIPVMLAEGALAAGLALRLCARRDLGAGLLPQRRGKARAGRSLRSPLGLAWRLTRGQMLAWAVALAAFGAMYGSVFEDMDAFLQSNELIRGLFAAQGYTLAEQFTALLMKILTMASVIPALTLALRLLSEERRGRAEHLATRAVSRARMMGAYAILSFCACAVMPLCAVMGLWGSAAVVMAEPIALTTMLAAGLAGVPAMLALCGFTFLLIGWRPNAAPWVYALLGYAFFTGWIGKLLRLPAWAGALSPFAYVADYPVEPLRAPPLILLAALAVALTAAGFMGYRKRDLQG